MFIDTYSSYLCHQCLHCVYRCIVPALCHVFVLCFWLYNDMNIVPYFRKKYLVSNKWCQPFTLFQCHLMELMRSVLLLSSIQINYTQLISVITVLLCYYDCGNNLMVPDVNIDKICHCQPKCQSVPILGAGTSGSLSQPQVIIFLMIMVIA